MKVRTGGRTIEIPDERVGGACPQRSRTSAPVKDGGLCIPSPVNHAPSPPGWPAKKDKWNYAYAQYLELERQAGRIVCWWYEPSSYWLPGQVRYKPDFLIWYPEEGRKLEYVEVKGWSRNLRDGITRYKIAASLWPCFTWKMVKRKGHGWEEYT